MPAALLILNVGSSSVRFSVFLDIAPPELLLRGNVEALSTAPQFTVKDAQGTTLSRHTWPSGVALEHEAAIEFVFATLQQSPVADLRLAAAGHRVVHGGVKFTRPTRVNDSVLAELEQLVPLAPLHQPHNLAAIRAVARHQPELPQVACFDTSFHRGQPAVAQEFAIPRRLTELGIRRYGFHGISYEFVASQLAAISPRAAAGRTVIAHLGNGASMCAMRSGRSLATTMSFTPLDGLVMGTRCGAIDPGVLLHLMTQHGMDAVALGQMLTCESGLLGVSGISSDMRVLLEHAAQSEPAAEAIELFVYRISRELGSLCAALGGLDALVFTGGIGENSPVIRERVCHAATWLGMKLDSSRNDHGGPRISEKSSDVEAWVIPTNEEQMIAMHTHNLLNVRQS